MTPFKYVAYQVLNSLLEDGEQGELLITIIKIAKAFGDVPELENKRTWTQHSSIALCRQRATQRLVASPQYLKPWAWSYPCSLSMRHKAKLGCLSVPVLGITAKHIC